MKAIDSIAPQNFMFLNGKSRRERYGSGSLKLAIGEHVEDQALSTSIGAGGVDLVARRWAGRNKTQGLAITMKRGL